MKYFVVTFHKIKHDFASNIFHFQQLHECRLNFQWNIYTMIARVTTMLCKSRVNHICKRRFAIRFLAVWKVQRSPRISSCGLTLALFSSRSS